MKHRHNFRTIMWIALILVFATVANAEAEKLSAQVIDEANSDGVVSVLVGVKVPWQREGGLSDAEVLSQRQAIDAVQQQLLAELNSTRYEVVQRFQEIPGIALHIGLDAVKVLEQSAYVSSVLLDHPVVASLEDNPRPTTAASRSQPDIGPGNVPREMFEHARSTGTVLVLVGLKAPWRPEAVLSNTLVSAQRNVIAASQDYLLAELSNTHYRITRRFQKIPGIALEVGLDALKILNHSAAVTNVLKDRPAKQKK